MKPVMQTDFGQFGNCFSACLASLFELPLEEVPNFFTVAGPYDDAAWWAAVRDWLRPRGYGIMFNDLRDPDHLKLFEGYFIVSGKSSRNIDHATIWKDGVMVHDPHPDQCGLIAPDGVDLIYPLDVAALSERGEEAVAYRYRMHPNFHWTLSYRFPVVPNNVEVQPLYTRTPAKQLKFNANSAKQRRTVDLNSYRFSPHKDARMDKQAWCIKGPDGEWVCLSFRSELDAWISFKWGTHEEITSLIKAGYRAVQVTVSENAVQELADRLEQYIPDGDGYNGEYAKTLTAAVAFLRGGSLE